MILFLHVNNQLTGGQKWVSKLMTLTITPFNSLLRDPFGINQKTALPLQ